MIKIKLKKRKPDGPRSHNIKSKRSNKRKKLSSWLKAKRRRSRIVGPSWRSTRIRRRRTRKSRSWTTAGTWVMAVRRRTGTSPSSIQCFFRETRASWQIRCSKSTLETRLSSCRFWASLAGPLWTQPMRRALRCYRVEVLKQPTRSRRVVTFNIRRVSPLCQALRPKS